MQLPTVQKPMVNILIELCNTFYNNEYNNILIQNKILMNPSLIIPGFYGHQGLFTH